MQPNQKIALRRFLLKIFLVVSALSLAQSAVAMSFALDSIAEWGRFPRFCVNVYRWGDKFFNSYDSTYVVGTGYKFNVKAVTNTGFDQYHFELNDGRRMDMNSDPTSTIGVHLTYLAVSAGYDANINKMFGGDVISRKRYRFGFDCALLSFETFFEDNKIGANMTRFGDHKNLDIPIDNIDIYTWGADLYYFFNNNNYSQAAAFNYSKVQKRSQGSFYAGLSYFMQSYDFNFNHLPGQMTEMLPDWWTDHHFKVKTYNYGIRIGYGYNWVFAPRWVVGASFSPTFALSRGLVNAREEELSPSMFLRGKLSVVWNNGRWFAGITGKISTAIIPDQKTYFFGNDISATAAIGYRFNLW